MTGRRVRDRMALIVTGGPIGAPSFHRCRSCVSRCIAWHVPCSYQVWHARSRRSVHGRLQNMTCKTLTAVAIGVALLGTSALAQTTAPSSGSGTPPASNATKPPAATQPGGTTQGGDTSKTPATSQTDSSKSKTMGQDTERTRSIQEALKAKGHDPGPIDGVFGPKTKAALKDFQKAEKL